MKTVCFLILLADWSPRICNMSILKVLEKLEKPGSVNVFHLSQKKTNTKLSRFIHFAVFYLHFMYNHFFYIGSYHSYLKIVVNKFGGIKKHFNKTQITIHLNIINIIIAISTG